MRVDFPKAKLFKTNTCFFLASKKVVGNVETYLKMKFQPKFSRILEKMP